ncbi:MAG: hypothetical protein ACYC97_11280 [Metallibacterium sp.]
MVMAFSAGLALPSLRRFNAIVFFAKNTEHCGKTKLLYLSFQRCSRSNMKT